MLVPTTNRRVNAAPLPSVRSQVEVRNPAAGVAAAGVATAMKGIGEGAEQFGQAMKVHQDKERLRGAEAASGAAKEAAEKRYLQFKSLEKQQVTDEEVTKLNVDLDKIYTDGAAGLDPEAAELYRRNVEPSHRGRRVDADWHKIGQQKVAQRETYVADQQLALRIAVDDPESEAGRINASRALTLAYQDPDLVDGAARQVNRDKAGRALAVGVMEQHLRADRPEDAQAWLDRAVADELTDPETGAKLHLNLDAGTVAVMREAIDKQMQPKIARAKARELDVQLRADGARGDTTGIAEKLHKGLDEIANGQKYAGLTEPQRAAMTAAWRMDIGEQMAVRQAFLSRQVDTLVPAIKIAVTGEAAMKFALSADPELQPKLIELAQSIHPVTSGKAATGKKEEANPATLLAAKTMIATAIRSDRNLPEQERTFKTENQVLLDAHYLGLSAEDQNWLAKQFRTRGEVEGLTYDKTVGMAATLMSKKVSDLDKQQMLQLFQDVEANWPDDKAVTDSELIAQLQRNLQKGVYADTTGGSGTYAEAQRAGRPFKPGPAWDRESWETEEVAAEAKRLGLPSSIKKPELIPGSPRKEGWIKPTPGGSYAYAGAEWEQGRSSILDALGAYGSAPVAPVLSEKEVPIDNTDAVIARRMAELSDNYKGVPVSRTQLRKVQGVEAAAVIDALKMQRQALAGQMVGLLEVDEKFRMSADQHSYGGQTGPEAMIAEAKDVATSNKMMAPDWLVDYLSHRPGSVPGTTKADDYQARMLELSPIEREAMAETFVRSLVQGIQHARSAR